MSSLRILGALMLMFLLCDADSTCPTAPNPLTLDPPELIGEIGGEPFLVNCTSADEDHEGMFWRLGNRVSETEDEKSYITWTVSLSDWNVTAECTVQLNENSACSKDLGITIYKNPDAVVVFPTRHSKAVVEGTPYEMQCDILNVAPVQNLTVRWYKDNQIIQTDSFTNTTKTPIDMSSSLIVNISRGEEGAQFKCEAQLDFGPDGPQTPPLNDIHTVSVHYAPELKNSTDVDVIVSEGNDLTLTCEAQGMPPPDFTWTCDGVNISENTNNLNITGVTDSATYNCTATNYLGSITKQIHVHVRKATRAAAPEAVTTPKASTERGCPLIVTPAEVVVRFGDPASINCSTSATDALGMGWEATSGGVGLTDTSALTWSVEKLQDWSITPMCFVNLGDFQCTKNVAVTIYKTPDMVSVSASDNGKIEEGKKYLLNCNIISVAPVQKLEVKWYRGGEIVQTQKFNDTSVVPVDVMSNLTITAEKDHNGAPFRCEAELHLGPNGTELIANTSLPYVADVLYKPLIKACPEQYAGGEDQFSLDKLDCQADGNPPPRVQWYYQGNEINASEPLSRSQSGKYTAEFENILGRSSTSVDITIEYKPLFFCDDYHYEVKEDSKPQTICEPKGLPKPEVIWTKDGENMKTPQRWTKHDSGEYILKAINRHGTANHTLYLDVLYAPVFKEGNHTMQVTPGDNVTLCCHAEGNPPPMVRWNFSSAVTVMETTGGRQNSICVTGATSTSAGVYICVATNKVGNVTRSVTLTLTGKASGIPSAVIWGLLILLIILVVVILIGISRNCNKKHGQYTFVPDAKEDPNRPIPMSDV